MTLAALAAGVVLWWSGLFDRSSAPPPHPLAKIEVTSFVSIERLSPEGSEQLSGEAFKRAAAAIVALKQAPRIDSRSVVWGSATLLRAVTRDGIALSLQVKPIANGAAVRVTADPASRQATGAAPDAAAIHGLRMNAYRLGPEAAAALLP